MGDWEEEMDMLPSTHPFPLPSLPFDEHTWIFYLLAKEETILQFIGWVAKSFTSQVAHGTGAYLQFL